MEMMTQVFGIDDFPHHHEIFIDGSNVKEISFVIALYCFYFQPHAFSFVTWTRDNTILSKKSNQKLGEVIKKTVFLRSG